MNFILKVSGANLKGIKWSLNVNLRCFYKDTFEIMLKLQFIEEEKYVSEDLFILWLDEEKVQKRKEKKQPEILVWGGPSANPKKNWNFSKVSIFLWFFDKLYPYCYHLIYWYIMSFINMLCIEAIKARGCWKLTK